MNLWFWGCMMAEQRHGGMNTWELTSWSSSRRQRALTKNGWAFEMSKPIPSDIPLPMIPWFLVLPKQFHQSGPSIQTRTSGGHSHSNKHSDLGLGVWRVVPDYIKSVGESREWESVWVISARHAIFTSKLRLWTWPSWPFAWPALSHFSPVKDVGLHVPMMWELVINSVKIMGKEGPKTCFSIKTLI